MIPALRYWAEGRGDQGKDGVGGVVRGQDENGKSSSAVVKRFLLHGVEVLKSISKGKN